MAGVLRIRWPCVALVVAIGLLVLIFFWDDVAVARWGVLPSFVVSGGQSGLLVRASAWSLYCNWDLAFLLLAITAPLLLLAGLTCAYSFGADSGRRARRRISFGVQSVQRRITRCTAGQRVAVALVLVWLAGLGYIWIRMMWGNGWQQALQLVHRCRHGDAHAMPAVDWDSETAVAYVCIGKGCALDQLQAAVATLRRCGKWDGAVYVVTDRPGDVMRVTGMWGTGNTVKTLVADGLPSTTMEIKQTKQRLFSLAPSKHGTLIYLDVDVLTVSPLREFMRSVRRDNGGRVPSIAMFRDNVCARCNRFNCGVVLMRDDPDARRCMAVWTKEIQSPQHYRKEQDALDAVLAQGHCSGIACLSNQRVVYTNGPVRSWFKMAALPVAFVHMTHSWRNSHTGKWVLPQVGRDLHSIVKGQVAGAASLPFAFRPRGQ